MTEKSKEFWNSFQGHQIYAHLLYLVAESLFHVDFGWSGCLSCALKKLLVKQVKCDCNCSVTVTNPMLPGPKWSRFLRKSSQL